ncbi:hypothetical protein B0A70_09990 [Chryseobacterium piscicola]|uniref:Uncharacterized protein n=1 Tax=Chryseobacterium piscicola TaxID=551459 RepID=A0A2S7KE68_9FLAO|nr:hypothetical protein B0A70_09990 [Chryseobacterium piscicola]
MECTFEKKVHFFVFKATIFRICSLIDRNSSKKHLEENFKLAKNRIEELRKRFMTFFQLKCFQ